MKKIACVFLAVLLLASMLAGCQQTPSEDIVVGKELEALIGKAKEGDVSGSLRERLGAPEVYRASFTGADGLIHVTAEAAVLVPDAQKVPIVRATSAKISQEQAYALLQSLTHADMYDPYEAAATQDAILRQITETKERLAQGPTAQDAGMTYYGGGKAMTWEQWMQAYLDSLTKQYAAAKDAPATAPISGEFKALEGGLYVSEGNGYSDAWGYECIQVSNGEGTGNSRALYYQNDAADIGFAMMGYELKQNTYRLKNPDVSGAAEPNILAEDARKLCDAWIEKLGQSSMQFYSAFLKYGGESWDGSSPARCCWTLQYTRAFEDIPVTYTNATDDVMIEGRTSIPWRYEALTFYVNDRGIVGLWWEASYETGKPWWKTPAF